ncbi:peptidylprolyl isomerase [Candidatus Woesearchaeota archaeon]|nr:MAG: peptidylprolyl isomerase [Candidatus Woesearchaeota archaeon]
MTSSAKTIARGDFIRVDFTARLVDDGSVVDTTKERVAQEANVSSQGATFGPKVICVGEGQWLSGLDKALVGKAVGSHKIRLSPEEAFGRKSPKLLQLIPKAAFMKQQVTPFPGMEVSIDNQFGVVRSVSGGRVLVDFNHPLAGREIEYELEVHEIVSDAVERAKAVLGWFGLQDAFVGAEGKTVRVLVQEEALKARLERVRPVLEDRLRRFTPFEEVGIAKERVGEKAKSTRKPVKAHEKKS